MIDIQQDIDFVKELTGTYNSDTPAYYQALDRVIGYIDQLRTELDKAQERIKELEELKCVEYTLRVGVNYKERAEAAESHIKELEKENETLQAYPPKFSFGDRVKLRKRAETAEAKVKEMQAVVDAAMCWWENDGNKEDLEKQLANACKELERVNAI